MDSEDLTVFDGIADDKTTPGKMAKPTVTGGAKKIAVKWSKSNDVGVTGYTVKYRNRQRLVKRFTGNQRRGYAQHRPNGTFLPNNILCACCRKE